MDPRKIIHIDMDAFYASVEQRDRPELRGRPIVVGGSPDSRGVVCSASYEARKFGVRSAISCSKAKRLCPEAIFVFPRFDAYREASDQIHEVFTSVTPLVEPLSLDEAYLDVTKNHLNEPLASKIAAHIKKEIRAKTGLTASAGVGPNKLVAKIASDIRKPDGLVVIPPEKVLEFVSPLPVEKLWGVGPATAKRLHRLGLRTARDIATCPPTILEAELGKFGEFLQNMARGEDTRPVESGFDPKSRGAETTLDKDTLDVSYLRELLREQAVDLCPWLKENEMLARTVTLKLRYRDFTTITRSRTLAFPTDRPEVIGEIASELLSSGTSVGEIPVRLIGISISGFLSRNEPHQLWFDYQLPGQR